MIRHIVILPYADGDGPALVKRGRCGARPPAALLSRLEVHSGHHRTADEYPLLAHAVRSGALSVSVGFIDRGTDREQPIIGWVESERFKAARAAREFPLFPARALVVAFEGEALDDGIDRLARVVHRDRAGLGEIVAALLKGADLVTSKWQPAASSDDGPAWQRCGVVEPNPNVLQLFRDVAARAGLAIFLDAEGREIEP